MIFEIRTYQLKPGTVPNAVQAFADKIQNRVKLSPLAGFWHTEVGELNKVVHLWAYESLDERARRRAELWADAEWLAYAAEVGPLVVDQANQILTPAPFFKLRR